MNEDEHEEILRLEDSFESAFMSSEMEKKWRKLPRNLSLIYLGESHSFYIYCLYSQPDDNLFKE